MTSPVDAARAAFSALEQGRWRTLVDLLHPEVLADVREQALGLLLMEVVAPNRLEPPTGGGSLVAIPNPDDGLVAHYASVKVPLFPGAPTIGELGALSPEDFYVRWQRASHNVPWVFRALLGIRRLFQPAQVEVLGGVTESNDLAHVVYREAHWQSPRAAVVTVSRVNGEWRVLPGRFQLSDPFRRGGAFPMADRPSFVSWLKWKVAGWFGVRRTEAE